MHLSTVSEFSFEESSHYFAAVRKNIVNNLEKMTFNLLLSEVAEMLIVLFHVSSIYDSR